MILSKTDLKIRFTCSFMDYYSLFVGHVILNKYFCRWLRAHTKCRSEAKGRITFPPFGCKLDFFLLTNHARSTHDTFSIPGKSEKDVT